MDLIEPARRLVGRALEALLALILALLALLVVAAVPGRILGLPIAWHGEVAGVLLAWLTFYGAALLALRRAHIAYEGFLFILPRSLRLAGLLLGELAVLLFLLLLAVTGWRVLQALKGVGLVSLSWLPLQLAQSAIPLAALLFILAEALSLPAAWRRFREGAGPQGGPQ